MKLIEPLYFLSGWWTLNIMCTQTFVILHDTLAHDALLYHVWLQKIQQLRRHCPDEHSPEFQTFPVTLTLTATEQSNLFTRQSSLWRCAIKSSLVAKEISSSEATVDSHWHFEPRCDFDLERSNLIFAQDTPAYDDVLSNQVWLQMDQQFGRYSKNSHILNI